MKLKQIETLLIVSHAIHWRYDGILYSYGPYAREIDIWADIFPHILIAAPLRNEKPPSDCLPFSNTDIEVAPQLERGGNAWQDKIFQLASLPALLFRLSLALRKADAIHVRCPGNLGLFAAILAPLFSKYRIAKYAGQWNRYKGEAWSYRLQRSILRSQWWNALVLVYGVWPDQPPYVKPFFTSVMNTEQLERAKAASSGKQLHHPLRVIFVGRLSRSKNVQVLINALGKLRDENIAAEARVIGDGPELAALKRLSDALDLPEKTIRFTGGMSFEKVLSSYVWADVLVLASETEGWPKAIAEGMAFGLVCVGTNRGFVPQMLANGRGLTVEPGDSVALASALKAIANGRMNFEPISRKAAEWGQQYSLEGLKHALKRLLISEWHLSPDDLG